MSLMPRLRNALLLSALAIGLPADAAQPEGPISVTADSGRFEQDAGTGVYQGNVELIQGQRKLFADEMRLFTRNGELVRVEASGQPVRMEEGEGLNAHANNLVYDINGRTWCSPAMPISSTRATPSKGPGWNTAWIPNGWMPAAKAISGFAW